MSYCAHLYIHLYIYFSHLHVNIFRLSHSQTPCINLFEVAKYAVYLDLNAWFIYKINCMPSRFLRTAYIFSISLFFIYVSSKYCESILSYLIIIKLNHTWPFCQINVQQVLFHHFLVNLDLVISKNFLSYPRFIPHYIKPHTDTRQ